MEDTLITRKDIEYVINAHTNYARKPSKAFRKWDGKTPYWVHPLWCATTIASEADLDITTRQEGALTLLFHDIIEDTTASLPDHLEPRVKELIELMTFPGGMAEETEKIFRKDTPKEIQLYKLYDKVHNLLDGSWMSVKKKAFYTDYTRLLAKEATKNYGMVNLNIVQLAKSLEVVPNAWAKDAFLLYA